MNRYEKALYHLKGVQDNADKIIEIAEKRKEELEQYKLLPAADPKIKVFDIVFVSIILIAIIFLIGNILGVPEFQWG